MDNVEIKNNKEEVPLAHYLALYKQLDPFEAGKRCAIDYDEGKKQFSIRCLGKNYFITYPEFKILPANSKDAGSFLVNALPAHILLIRYLIEGNNVGEIGGFLSYRDFPWGEVYYANFRGRCILRLTGIFGKRPDAFKEAMGKIGAKPISESDCGFEFEFINNLNMRFLLWEGDEEFPPSMQILFSDNFALAFSAEDMAVIGDITISTIKNL